MSVAKKSAKDLAFDRERIKLKNQIKQLEDRIRYWQAECEKEVIIREHSEQIIEMLEAENKELAEKIGIPLEDLRQMINDKKKGREAAEAVAGLLGIVGNSPKY